MRLKSLVVAAAAAGLLTPAFAQQAAPIKDGDWMVRVRAVDLIFQNGQSGVASTLNVKAQNVVIPEFDVSYFFTKNISAELVLTYPQQVQINAGSNQIGKITALPPSLLAQYHFTDLGAFVPYVGAGINYTIFGNIQNFPALGNGVKVNQSSVGFAGQVGFDYFLDKNWGLNVDLKYITMATDIKSVASGNSIGKLTLNPWTPAVGVSYKF